MRIRKPLWILILLILSFLYPSTIRPSTAQGICGDTYTVLPGDTLSEIAELCGTTVDAIMAANPQITDPTQIFVGQTIRIPRSQNEPVLAISVECGLVGTELLVLGSGYPPNSNVEIRLFQKNRPVIIAGQVTSDVVGWIETRLTIPSSIVVGTPLYIIAEARHDDNVFTGTSSAFYLISPTIDPNAPTTYFSQRGDTLRSIANKYNRSLDALFEANPQISDPFELPPGQRINIPAQAAGVAVITLAPICGPSETTVQVAGDGFPSGTTVNLKSGPYLSTDTFIGSVKVDSSQAFAINLVIPLTAVPGQYWAVVGETTSSPKVRATSNLFTVTQPRDPNAPLIHIVQPDESLNEIADIYKRSVSSILSVNPHINNPNQLNADERLIIPRIEEVIAIAPMSGPIGTILQIGGRGFPANAKVEISYGRKNTKYTVIETVITDSNGIFLTQATIPGSANPGEKWVVVGTLASAEDTQITATSEEFTVTKPAEVLHPVISIYPLNGVPNSSIHVVASGFPSYTKVQISIWKQDIELPPIIYTWTEVNGTFAVDMIVPASVISGETLVIVVKTSIEPFLEATSPVFTVAKAGSP